MSGSCACLATLVEGSYLDLLHRKTIRVVDNPMPGVTLHVSLIIGRPSLYERLGSGQVLHWSPLKSDLRLLELLPLGLNTLPCTMEVGWMGTRLRGIHPQTIQKLIR